MPILQEIALPMTAENLRIVMKKMNMRAKDLSWLSGSTMRSISRWRSGHSAVPQPIALLLKAYYEGKLSERWFVESIDKPVP